MSQTAIKQTPAIIGAGVGAIGGVWMPMLADSTPMEVTGAALILLVSVIFADLWVAHRDGDNQQRGTQ